MKERVLFFVTEDWAFWCFRLSLARAIRDIGYEVVVVTRVRDFGEKILSENFTLVPLEINRSGLNPFRDVLIIFKLIKIFLKYRPAVVQNISIKPVLYGTLVARITRVPKVNSLLNGMGILFSPSSDKQKTIIQKLVKIGFRLILNWKCVTVVVQNSVDRMLLVDEIGLPENQVVLIKGSGVNTNFYYPNDEFEGTIRITMVGRLLWDKGVGVLVDAAALLKERNLDFVITLVGSVDNDNPNSINQNQIDQWVNLGLVEYWGQRDDINSVWKKSHIAVLPTSYREGLPKALLEAASCGRPIVSSDNPGCLEIVEHNKNGIIVPEKSPIELANALEELILNKGKRIKFGENGRKKVLQYFSDEIVIKRTLFLYFG